MQEHGLILHSITENQREIWQNEVQIMSPNLRGEIIPADVYDTVIELTKDK